MCTTKAQSIMFEPSVKTEVCTVCRVRSLSKGMVVGKRAVTDTSIAFARKTQMFRTSPELPLFVLQGLWQAQRETGICVLKIGRTRLLRVFHEAW